MIFLFACSSEEEELERFIDTYREVLIARETHVDSSEANAAVREVFREHGYTEPEFRRKYFDLARDTKRFIVVLDSVRNMARRQIKASDSIESEMLMREDSTEISQQERPARQSRIED